MSLSEDGIRGMQEVYEGDHRTGMDTAEMAHQLSPDQISDSLTKESAPQRRGALIHEMGA